MSPSLIMASPGTALRGLSFMMTAAMKAGLACSDRKRLMEAMTSLNSVTHSSRIISMLFPGSSSNTPWEILAVRSLPVDGTRVAMVSSSRTAARERLMGVDKGESAETWEKEEPKDCSDEASQCWSVDPLEVRPRPSRSDPANVLRRDILAGAGCSSDSAEAGLAATRDETSRCTFCTTRSTAPEVPTSSSFTPWNSRMPSTICRTVRSSQSLEAATFICERNPSSAVFVGPCTSSGSRPYPSADLCAK
mmetsp:Transcript_55765/g.131657  ORF Transcript_55765/g.131657 Transcript_55765/m.131657 type:complete len:249 (+) Transcript_55765:349-1095(+)